ncbi:class I glutamine amidotransferase-like protein [Mrakia frigida]|uniref:type 1 glutamine amidotransferase n=1 Tax=Mrakia frigida TaxID=29902 RepID=UPI003FCC1B26
MTSKILNIAFLSDTRVDEPRNPNGTASSDLFLNLFESLLPPQTIINPTKFNVVKSRLPSDEELSSLDALIISGGFEDDAYSDHPWVFALGEFILRVSKEFPKIKIVGICFGMQLIGKVFGGDAGKNPAGLECGTVTMDLTELGKELLGSDLGDASNVNRMILRELHWDMVTAIPPAFQLLASSDLTPVQSMVRFYKEGSQEDLKLEDRVHIIGFQGHLDCSPLHHRES